MENTTADRNARLPNRRKTSPTLIAVTIVNLLVTFAAALRARAAATRHDESGNVITDNLAWIVFGVIAIVAIGALIKALGANVVNYVTKQLGI